MRYELTEQQRRDADAAAKTLQDLLDSRAAAKPVTWLSERGPQT